MTPTPQETRTGLGTDSIPTSPKPKDSLLGKAKKEKKKKVSKGVETLFRTTLSNHTKLSEMADRKANLMISINTIIVSITISAYTRKFDAPSNLLIPSLLLLTVSLVTIIVSLIATNPTISSRTRRGDVLEAPPIDLLFFGSYAKLTADEYRQKLRKLLSNEEALYTSLIDNLYAQGQVLSRKYRLLKFAYQFFMIGFSAVIILVIMSLLLTY